VDALCVTYAKRCAEHCCKNFPGNFDMTHDCSVVVGQMELDASIFVQGLLLFTYWRQINNL
jgi:hypothetical protein